MDGRKRKTLIILCILVFLLSAFFLSLSPVSFRPLSWFASIWPICRPPGVVIHLHQISIRFSIRFPQDSQVFSPGKSATNRNFATILPGREQRHGRPDAAGRTRDLSGDAAPWSQGGKPLMIYEYMVNIWFMMDNTWLIYIYIYTYIYIHIYVYIYIVDG